MKTINQVNQALVAYCIASEENPNPQPISVIPCSSVKGKGIKEIQQQLDKWFDPITSKYDEMGIKDLKPIDKTMFELGQEQEEQSSSLSHMIASPITKGHTNKQRYSPTARRLGTSKPFVDPKKASKEANRKARTGKAHKSLEKGKASTKKNSKSSKYK